MEFDGTSEQNPNKNGGAPEAEASGTAGGPEHPPALSPRRRWGNFIVVALVVVGGLAYIAKVRHDQERAVAQAGGAAGGSLMFADDVSGRPMPDWTLKTLDGKPVHFADLKGKPVVLDFWASWCEPCKSEIPSWNQLQHEYQAQGLTIVGVSEDDSDADVRNFLRETRMDYTIVLDHDQLLGIFGTASGLPTTFFIRRNGTIAKRVIGAEGASTLEQLVKGIL